MGARHSCMRNGDGAPEAEAHEQALFMREMTRIVLCVLSPYLSLSTRARCTGVCRAWRDALADPSLWARLHIPAFLCDDTDEPDSYVRSAVLHGAVARARSTLRELTVAGELPSHAVYEELLPVVVGNARTLRALSFSCNEPWEFSLAAEDTPSGAVAASKLGRTQAAVPRAQRMTVSERRVVAGWPAYTYLYDGRMTLHAVQQQSDGAAAGAQQQQQQAVLFDVRTAEDVAAYTSHDNCCTLCAPLPEATAGAAARALAAEIEAHTSLLRLDLRDFMLDASAALVPIVAAVHTRRLARLELRGCSVSFAALPALTALFGSDSLLRVFSFSDGELPLDEESAAALGDSVHASSALSGFTLCGARGMAPGAMRRMVQHGFTAHPSLQKLELLQSRKNEMYDFAGCIDADTAVQLGAMLAANAPALLELSIDCRGFRHLFGAAEAALAPLFAALPHNTHLRVLLFYNPRIYEPFAAGVLLPAVRANTALRVFGFNGEHITPSGGMIHIDRSSPFTTPSMEEARRLVHQRAMEALMFGVVAQPPPASYVLPPLDLHLRQRCEG
jgi:hypothetical protein